MHHGCGGGRTQGAKANALGRLAELYPGCDVYMEGHTHSYQHFISEVPMIDRKRGNLVHLPAHFVCTGHFLEWKGCYGEEFKLPPKPAGAAVVTLRHRTTGNFQRKKVSCDFYQG